jgi:hypothetical protein
MLQETPKATVVAPPGQKQGGAGVESPCEMIRICWVYYIVVSLLVGLGEVKTPGGATMRRYETRPLLECAEAEPLQRAPPSQNATVAFQFRGLSLL